MRDSSTADGLGSFGRSVWTILPSGRKTVQARDTVPLTTRPDPISTQPLPLSLGIASLDGVRAAFWQAYRHLFPSHSLAAQTPNGSIVISWSVVDDPHASHPYAAPVMLRLDDALVTLMENSDANQRRRIAQAHEPALREGLRGYDPFARIPNARIVSLG